MPSIRAIFVAGALVTVLSGTASVQAADGPSVAGCVSQSGSPQCIKGKALDYAREIAISPDDKNVYVASGQSDAIASFFRDPATGLLRQLQGRPGCISETGTSGTCVDGNALDDPDGVAVSPDGKNVYVASGASNAVAVLRRDTTTGALTQLPGTAGCYSQTGTSGTCMDGKALGGPDAVMVSPDGANVYVASSWSDSVAVFSRNSGSGALTQLPQKRGCVSETGTGGACLDGKALDGAMWLVSDADGTSVTVASYFSDAVTVLSREPTTGALTPLEGQSGCVSETGSGGACVDGRGLDGVNEIAMSPNGKHVYAASYGSDALAFLRRDPSGHLTQAAGSTSCISETGTGGMCMDGRGLDGLDGVVLSPDGLALYVTAADGDGAAFLTRDPSTGRIAQLRTPDACISETGSAGGCIDGRALQNPNGIVSSSDGAHLYIASRTSDAATILVPADG